MLRHQVLKLLAFELGEGEQATSFLYDREVGGAERSGAEWWEGGVK